MTAFGKLIRTTAFRLTLAYLFLFALFAASLLGYFAWNTPPSVGRLKGGEVPQLHRPLFSLTKRWQVALHEHADRAMVKEGWPT